MVAALFGAVLGLLLAGPAWAREDPPDVTGLAAPDAASRLIAWNKGLAIAYEPPLDVNLGVDPALVVVARAEWPQGTLAVSARPFVRLHLGRSVPDLTGLTADRARDEVGRVAMRLLTTPTGAGPDWTVSVQTPPAGAIVEFVGGTRVVDAVLTAPIAPTPTAGPTLPPIAQPPPSLSTVELVVYAGSGLATVLLLVLGGLALRRSLRRRPDTPQAAEHVQVRGHAGETIGPTLAETGPALSVRLVGRHGTATIDVEEAGR